MNQVKMRFSSESHLSLAAQTDTHYFLIKIYNHFHPYKLKLSEILNQIFKDNFLFHAKEMYCLKYAIKVCVLI